MNIHKYIEGNYSGHWTGGLGVYLQSDPQVPFSYSQLKAILTGNPTVTITGKGLALIGGSPNHTEQAVFDCAGGEPLVADLNAQPLISVSNVTLCACSVIMKTPKGALPMIGVEAKDDTVLVFDSVDTLLLADSNLRDSAVRIVNSANTTVTAVDMQNSAIVVDDDRPSVLVTFSGVTVHDTTALPQNYRASLTVLSGTGGVTVEKSHFTDNHVLPVLIHALASVKITSCQFVRNDVDGRSYEESYHTGSLSSGLGIRIPSQTQAKFVQITTCTFRDNTLLTTNSTLAASGAGLQVVFANSTNGVSMTVSGSVFSNNSLFKVFNSPWAKHNHIDTGAIPSATYHGGGASFLFLERANWNSLQVLNCDFSYNRAVRGGGMTVEFWGASNNSVTILGNGTSCAFIGNKGTSANKSEDALTGRDFEGMGGGLYTSFQVSSNVSCEGNVLNVTGCLFEMNGAAEAGGMYVGVCDVTALNEVYISNSVFRSNTAITGAGASLWSCYMFAPVKLFSEKKLVVEDVLFESNTAFFRGALSVTTLEFHTKGVVTFSQNANTGLFLRMAIQRCHGQIIYDSNIGQVGGGLFSSASRIIIYGGSSAQFTNNTALWSGGGMYVESGVR